MGEYIEQRGQGWRVRYKDNPDDPWTMIGWFKSRREALRWLHENPVVEADARLDEDQE